MHAAKIEFFPLQSSASDHGQQLKEIKSDLTKDGIKWDSASPETNLINLWKKYKRTLTRLEESFEEIKTIKTQQRKQNDEMQQYLTNIKQLQKGKNDHVQQMMGEIKELRDKVQQSEKERMAYLKQHQAITDLLITEESSEFDTFKKVQELVKECNSLQETLSSAQKQLEETQEEKKLVETEAEKSLKILREDLTRKREEDVTKLSDEKKALIEENTGLMIERNELSKQLEETKEKDRLKEEALENITKQHQSVQNEIKQLREQYEEEKLNLEEAQTAKKLGNIIIMLNNYLL